ncbi:MAG: TerB family tellurite resistance protein [Myxococcota bacterium]
MPFIIWGTRGVTSTAESGQFHCPRCGQTPYDLKRVRRFFTLYWIPLIPLDTLGEYVECGGCANTFDKAVLDYDPEADHKKFLSKLDKASRRLMALMVLADGDIDDEEIAAMVKVSEMLPGGNLTDAEARAEVDAAAKGSRDIVEHVIDVRDFLNDAGKGLLLRVALAIAMADGEFADEEKVLLLQIGEALGMDGASILAAIGSDGEA